MDCSYFIAEVIAMIPKFCECRRPRQAMISSTETVAKVLLFRAGAAV